MHPEAVLLTDVGDVVDGVERPSDRGARGGGHEERELAQGHVATDQGLQGGHGHAGPGNSAC